MLFSATKCVSICYSSRRKLVHSPKPGLRISSCSTLIGKNSCSLLSWLTNCLEFLAQWLLLCYCVEVLGTSLPHWVLHTSSCLVSACLMVLHGAFCWEQHVHDLWNSFGCCLFGLFKVIFDSKSPFQWVCIAENEMSQNLKPDFAFH